jgi:MFS family permease
MRRYLIFISAGLSLLMYSIDSTAVAVAFPHFIKDFGTNVLWAAWTISIYLVAVTSVMPLMGNLSVGIHWGVAKMVVVLIMATGIGAGIALPASNNACIELMPEKVATITGLRGMFRSVGGAFGISLITIILHLSSTPANGFRATFISFGLGLLFTIPLVFLMPTGKKGVG